MRQIPFAVVLAAVGGFAIAQPGQPPGNNFVPDRNDAALQALSQLLGELAVLRSELQVLPPNIQLPLVRQADEVTNAFRGFYLAAARRVRSSGRRWAVGGRLRRQWR